MLLMVTRNRNKGKRGIRIGSVFGHSFYGKGVSAYEIYGISYSLNRSDNSCTPSISCGPVGALPTLQDGVTSPQYKSIGAIMFGVVSNSLAE